MARVRKVELTSEEIKAQITSIEEQITKLTEDIKGLRVQKNNLSKDLCCSREERSSRKRRTVYERILSKLLREKGLSVEDVRNMLDKESK